MKKYIQALGIWALIIPFAILNGGLRDYILRNLIGKAAMPISGMLLSLVIIIVAYIFIPKIKGSSKLDYVLYGLMWFILTNFFDIVGILQAGKPFSDYLKMFDLSTGSTWILVLISCFLAPILAGNKVE